MLDNLLAEPAFILTCPLVINSVVYSGV